MTQERRIHHAVLICITVMERGNWASSSRLHLHLVTEEEEVPSSELRQRTHYTHVPSLRGHKNCWSRAMGGGAALATLHNVQLYFSHHLGGRGLFTLRSRCRQRAPGHWPDTEDCQHWLLHISVTRAAQGAAAVQLRWSAHDTGRPNERTGPGSVGTYHQHHQHQMQMLLLA